MNIPIHKHSNPAAEQSRFFSGRNYPAANETAKDTTRYENLFGISILEALDGEVLAGEDSQAHRLRTGNSGSLLSILETGIKNVDFRIIQETLQKLSPDADLADNVLDELQNILKERSNDKRRAWSWWELHSSKAGDNILILHIYTSVASAQDRDEAELNISSHGSISSNYSRQFDVPFKPVDPKRALARLSNFLTDNGTTFLTRESFDTQ